MKRLALGLSSLLMLAVAACETTAPTSLQPAQTPASILADPARSDGDRSNDARRKAVEALAFMQIRPGSTILDMEAGSGYWSEILARATGPTGKVIMQNPPVFETRLGAAITARLAGNRLTNMTVTYTNFDALQPATGSVDLVTWIQGPHELYFTPTGGASLGNPTRAWQEIARVLKSGGRLVVIDHNALPGQPATTGQTIHRIDPAITIASAAVVGLRLESRADFLANPADPKTKTVFDPSIRGRTDQHVLRFVKR